MPNIAGNEGWITLAKSGAALVRLARIAATERTIPASTISKFAVAAFERLPSWTSLTPDDRAMTPLRRPSPELASFSANASTTTAAPGRERGELSYIPEASVALGVNVIFIATG